MNDNFLYELRAAPSSEFAARLKRRLDVQALEARQKRRSIKWFVFGAILMGGTALAFVSPLMRQATLTMIMQFRGASENVTEHDRAPQVRMASTRPGPMVTSSPSGVALAGDATARSTGSSTLASAVEGAREVGPTLVPAGPAEQRAATVGARLPTPVRFEYSPSLKALAKNVVADLERRFNDVRMTSAERPTDLSLCARSAPADRPDVFLSDRRLSKDGSVVCDGYRPVIELPIAYDALVIVKHRENSWMQAVSIADLAKLNGDNPASPLITWSQVRSEWPTLPVALVGMSFQESAVGSRFAKATGAYRELPSFERTQDDRATLRRVESLHDAVGFIDFATLNAVLQERSAWPTVVPIVNAKGESVSITADTIQDGSYELARPIWLYLEKDRLRRFDVWRLLEAIYTRPPEAIERSGFVSVGTSERQAAMRSLLQARPDSMRY